MECFVGVEADSLRLTRCLGSAMSTCDRGKPNGLGYAASLDRREEGFGQEKPHYLNSGGRRLYKIKKGMETGQRPGICCAQGSSSPGSFASNLLGRWKSSCAEPLSPNIDARCKVFMVVYRMTDSWLPRNANQMVRQTVNGSPNDAPRHFLCDSTQYFA